MARVRKNRLFNQHPTSEAGFDQIDQRLAVILSLCRHYYIPGIEISNGLTDRSMVPRARSTADDAHIDANVTQYGPMTDTNRTRAYYYGALQRPALRTSSRSIHVQPDSRPVARPATGTPDCLIGRTKLLLG